MIGVAIRKYPKRVVTIDRLRCYVTKIVGWGTSDSTDGSHFFNNQGILHKCYAVRGRRDLVGFCTQNPAEGRFGEGMRMVMVEVWE